MRQAVTRRQFLASALRVGALVLAGDAVCGGVLTTRLQQGLLSSTPNMSLSDLFVHKESARAIGVEYLSTHQSEADERILLDLISGTVFGHEGRFVSTDEHEVKQLLQQSIYQDFETDQIVQVHGWILSVTEARLCALTVVA